MQHLNFSQKFIFHLKTGVEQMGLSLLSEKNRARPVFWEYGNLLRLRADDSQPHLE